MVLRLKCFNNQSGFLTVEQTLRELGHGTWTIRNTLRELYESVANITFKLATLVGRDEFGHFKACYSPIAEILRNGFRCLVIME
ncbi:hypothetical protein NPIL_352301 [Nephila pilipes]|uniref:Uncharacterized protein n=1 Tax=Nephila pilipes TaxID=299642 RepID=A0A8X6UQ99_NEPPI|nr:hypothetical protein NPIL_352301 [Nephila pilipes]